MLLALALAWGRRLYAPIDRFLGSLAGALRDLALGEEDLVQREHSRAASEGRLLLSRSAVVFPEVDESSGMLKATAARFRNAAYSPYLAAAAMLDSRGVELYGQLHRFRKPDKASRVSIYTAIDHEDLQGHDLGWEPEWRERLQGYHSRCDDVLHVEHVFEGDGTLKVFITPIKPGVRIKRAILVLDSYSVSHFDVFITVEWNRWSPIYCRAYIYCGAPRSKGFPELDLEQLRQLIYDAGNPELQLLIYDARRAKVELAPGGRLKIEVPLYFKADRGFREALKEAGVAWSLEDT